MAANKGTTTTSPPVVFRLLRFLWQPAHRGRVLSAAVVLAAISGSVWAWRRWGEPHLPAGDYLVTPERIAITPLPPWIHSDLKADVIRSAGLAQCALRDPKLVEQVAHGFSLHPWVAKVIRVQKRFPAQVVVELKYRRPVAAVSIDVAGERGLLFIDEESVLLPSIDFAPTQAKDYLRIRAPTESPASIYGTPWGSPRIAGAARVAAAWGERWKPLGLYWLVAAPGASGEFTYELRPQQEQVRVIWGAPPGQESPREPSSEQKIAALEHYVQDKGPLDRLAAPTVIDLRTLAAPAATAARGDRRPAR